MVERRLLDVRDLTALPDAGFDAVVAYGGPLSYAFEDAEPSLAGLLRIVRPGGRVVASVMALIGTLRMFVRIIPGYAANGRLDELKAVMATGDNRLDTGGHPCRMFRWSEIEAMAARLPCAVLGASASNNLSSGDHDVIASIEQVPGLVAALARLGGGVLRRTGCGGQRHASAVRPGAFSRMMTISGPSGGRRTALPLRPSLRLRGATFPPAQRLEPDEEGEDGIGHRRGDGHPPELTGGERRHERARHGGGEEERDSPVDHDTARTTFSTTQPMANAPGMVSIHAHTTCPATPHRTAESRRAAPTPTMAPVMVWVVETGMPADDV